MKFGTIYDPKKHGVMTDEERYAYNQKLMDAVPKIQMGDSHAWTMYRAYLHAGNKEKAMQYKEGHDRHKERAILFQQNLKARLFTKEELQLIEKVQKMADKDLEERLKRKFIRMKDFKKLVE